MMHRWQRVALYLLFTSASTASLCAQGPAFKEIQLPEVRAAQVQASQHFVNIFDLHDVFLSGDVGN